MKRVSKPPPPAVKRRRAPVADVVASRPSSSSRTDPAFERNIYSQLAGRLGQEIVSSVYPAGSLLPSAEAMCARFSVSRTALREAYSILSAKALIVARPKIGTRVRPKAEWNLLDPEVLAWHLAATPGEHLVDELFDLRQMVEPPAAALAAAAPSRETVRKIDEAFSRMERFKTGEGDLVGADLDFHMAILEASGNRFLAALGGLIHTALECSFQLSWRGAQRIRDDRLLQHHEVFEAIRDRSPERARERMATLLKDSIGDVREHLRLREEEARSRAGV